MQLQDSSTVIISGNCFGEQVIIEMSILQLAKIFGTDREVGTEIGDGFGSEEYEEQCHETREFVAKYPNIKTWDKELEFCYNSVQSSTTPDKVLIYAEELVGWPNEGLRIEFPAEIYNKKLKEKHFRIFCSPYALKFRIDE